MRPTSDPRVVAAALLTASLAMACHQPIVPREPASPPAPGAVTQEVALRIDSPLAGTVLVKAGEGGGVVCEAPCLRSVTIEEAVHYELHAPAHLPTAPFKLHSPEDPEVWLVHEPTTPGTLWALRTATIASAGVGTALFATANVLGASGSSNDEVPLTLGVSGLAIGLGVAAIFGGLTAAYADSDHELRDPALPGFRW